MGPGRRVVRRVEAGAGEPAVVLEAGLNNGAASWQRALPSRPRAARKAALGAASTLPGLPPSCGPGAGEYLADLVRGEARVRVGA